MANSNKKREASLPGHIRLLGTIGQKENNLKYKYLLVKYSRQERLLSQLAAAKPPYSTNSAITKVWSEGLLRQRGFVSIHAFTDFSARLLVAQM